MTGEDHSVVGHFCQSLEAFVHRLRVGTWKVGTSATVEKERVAGYQAIARQETLASRRVARGVNERDVDVAHFQHVTSFVCNDV